MSIYINNNQCVTPSPSRGSYISEHHALHDAHSVLNAYKMKTRFSHIWSEVVRFTPIALFLVVLTYVGSQAYLSEMSANMLASSNSGSREIVSSHVIQAEVEDSSDEEDEDDEIDEEDEEDEDDEIEDNDEEDELEDDDSDSEDDSDAEDAEDDDTTTGTRVITDGEAVTIALAYAGLTREEVSRLAVKYNDEHNVYVVKMKNDIVTVEVSINAETKEVVRAHKEIEDEDDDDSDSEDDAVMKSLLAQVPAAQQKMLRKLLEDVAEANRQAVVDAILDIAPELREQLLQSNSGKGSNVYFRHARAILKKEGLDAFRAFIVSEHDLHAVLTAVRTEKVSQELEKKFHHLLDRLESFSFPEQLAEEVKGKVQSIQAAAEAGTLTADLLHQFKEEIEELIHEAKQAKVDEGITPFIDVDESASESVSADFVEDIAFLKDEGITQGYEDGTFRGDRQISRGEYIAMILRAKYGVVGIKEKIASVSLDVLPADVPRTSSLARLIALGYQDGVTNASGAFGYERAVTRAEAMVLAARAFGIDVAADVQSSFSDTTNLNGEFRGIINKAASDGIVSGQSGRFRPADAIRRDEAAKIIHRAVMLWLEENPR